MPRAAPTETWRLLRVLLVRIGALPARPAFRRLLPFNRTLRFQSRSVPV